ncbi:HAD family hydrolase [Paenibacillus apiarius]|uniref:Phosphoserine phosphatase n=1 Tax=Paenibacillus apiarius TaxID=46240 RepID=A0ABT4DTY5_9BACL|nr:HAD family hydrolase [Paenibacillus apiarius]MCY9515907.1 HAD family hydrolase [Paenibacillus apiarius]MCY9520817.1 HAD family hydrolase [Paenibacillus apiarius]MCY9553522.1 HAD family hydrolase [Paenibacillus apiarius]MCY9557955.1 HAD family hydrolase [Paenibacillus apiarius]MCY9685810.1 HAD family hydrolase [Paenibacillus apiarius]
MSIQAVLFDLDDTLLWDERCVEEAFAATCQYAQSKTGANPERLEAEVRQAARDLYASYGTYSFTQNIGINPFEALWGHFTGGEHQEFRMLQQLAPMYRQSAWTRGLQAMRVEDDVLGAELAERFMNERRSRSYVYEETYEVLSKLKTRYPLLLLTNGSPDLQQEKLDGVPDLIPFFDHIVISGNYPEGKPAISLFQHAMSLLNIEPSEGLMVGDKLTTDIQGAHNVGMHHAWLNRKGLELSGDIHPEYEISDLSQLFAIIDQIDSMKP